MLHWLCAHMRCFFSSALEELSVRSNLALTQKKFFNEVIAVDATDKEELDAEYDSLCAQVVRCRIIWGGARECTVNVYSCILFQHLMTG